ncbi:MAG: sulfur transferase domain-containing protein, partial [Caulobacterales bacterium]
MSETAVSENPKSAKGFDLETVDGRKRARRQLFWEDHGFLRAMFHNFHWISPEMARANQPSPEEIARYAALGIKTIINLRGADDSGAYWLEAEACRQHGIALVDAPLSSRKPPTVERILRAKEIFETIRYPALMHCKSGADRASLMGVLYRHFREGAP